MLPDYMESRLYGIPSEIEGLQYLNLRIRYGTPHEPVRWITPSRRQKMEESKRTFQRK
jgi:hypothetical protein